MEKIADVLAPWFYPSRYRQAKLDWENVATDQDSILKSLEGHPLAVQLSKFVDSLYDNLNPDGKLILAVFCANYNQIVTHYTSLRIKRTFEFLEIPIEKGELFARSRSRGNDANNEASNSRAENGNYENEEDDDDEDNIGYWHRLVREARNERRKRMELFEIID